jgi:uncharacterized protein (DUF2164 family)
MTQIKRKGDFFTREQKKKIVDEIITYFGRERDETIGIISAEEVLDFFLQNVGEHIYNKGIEDAKQLLRLRFADFDVDLDLLQIK